MTFGETFYGRVLGPLVAEMRRMPPVRRAMAERIGTPLDYVATDEQLVELATNAAWTHDEDGQWPVWYQSISSGEAVVVDVIAAIYNGHRPLPSPDRLGVLDNRLRRLVVIAIARALLPADEADRLAEQLHAEAVAETAKRFLAEDKTP